MTQTFKKGDKVVIMENGWNELHCILDEDFNDKDWAMAKVRSITFDSKPKYMLVRLADVLMHCED
jgi:hypothetical protein